MAKQPTKCKAEHFCYKHHITYGLFFNLVWSSFKYIHLVPALVESSAMQADSLRYRISLTVRSARENRQTMRKDEYQSSCSVNDFILSMMEVHSITFTTFVTSEPRVGVNFPTWILGKSRRVLVQQTYQNDSFTYQEQ